jgi:hypothetical protein
MTRPTWMTAQALSRGLAVRKAAVRKAAAGKAAAGKAAAGKAAAGKAAAGKAGREAAMVVRRVLIVDCAVDRAVRQGHGAGR